MTHIHLLNDDFREDKRPTKLVDNALNTLADTCKWKYEGATTDKKAKVTDYNLRDMFDKKFQDSINQYNQYLLEKNNKIPTNIDPFKDSMGIEG